uniref:Histidine biosynthesis bifunctional protein HisIE n=1 Tax=Fervidobacterium pennivorans TaxID=93466 RepID=A0A7V4KD61_FERPE
MLLFPVIVQEAKSGEVLMLAYANNEAIELTKSTGYAHFFSRERRKIWKKGETSGNVMKVVEIRKDCDEDAYLYIVNFPDDKVACHTGNRSCFFKSEFISATSSFKPDIFLEHEQKTSMTQENLQAWSVLYKTVLERKNNLPEGSYTAKLFVEGKSKIAKKFGEEAVEVITGYLMNDKENAIWEIADLIYHLTVLMVDMDVTLEDVIKELNRRRK